MYFKEKLEDLIEKISELKDLAERSQKSRRKTGTMCGCSASRYLYKNIEDGILNNIHNAGKEQLINFLENYRFYYYSEYNDRELLKNEVNRRLRDNKLKQLLDD
jgi:predicted house-cleaning noncanonical NTP pyrophosphatase (MazG superfamily)